MALKPQDTLLLVKYWSLQKSGDRHGVRRVAQEISISSGEVSKATRRLVSAHLAVARDNRVFAETGAMLEWLAYGVRYAYPMVPANYGRGMPTSWNCPLLSSELIPPSPPFVWAFAQGEVEGVQIRPLHASIPHAASRDPLLYQIFALVDAIRAGKPRELAIARDLLHKLVKDAG